MATTKRRADDVTSPPEEEEQQGVSVSQHYLQRWLQALVVLHWLLNILLLPSISVLTAIFLLFCPPMTPVVIAYLIWMVFIDCDTPKRGGRRWDCIGRWRMWHYYRDYFPISLVKTADLDATRNHIIVYHPHGVISCGAFCNFLTEATGFQEKFPGIRPYLLTLTLNFYWPFLRDYILWAGFCDVGRDSVRWLLFKKEGGVAAVIVVGAAEEAMVAQPGEHTLTILARKGFVKMALETGSALVPCYAFGENDIFKQAPNPPGSLIRRIQLFFKRIFRFVPVLFYGNGCLPYRRPITAVVGAPILVPQIPDPDQDTLDRYHNIYLTAVNKLFEENKLAYGVQPNKHLRFI